MSRASLSNPADLLPPSARPVPRPSRGDGWNALADIEVFVFAVEAELEAMEPGAGRRAPPRPQARPRAAAAADRADLDADLRRPAVAHRRAGSRGFPSPPCTAASRAGPAWGCGAGWASVSRLTGAWPAATRCCPRRWWPTAVRSGPPRPPGCAGIDGGKLVKGIEAASWSATSTARCSISNCSRPTRTTAAAHPADAAAAGRARLPR